MSDSVRPHRRQPSRLAAIHGVTKSRTRLSNWTELNWYMFQCHSPKSSPPLPLPQSPKDCSIHLCLFCCLAYRVIITIFRSTLGPFSHFLFLSTLQFYMDYLCSPKSLEAGRGCVRSLQGHTRVLGGFFSLYSWVFWSFSILCLHMILRGWFLCSFIFFILYFYIFLLGGR